MFGSNIIVIEHLEESVFNKFVAVFLTENGFSGLVGGFRKTDIGINYTAVKQGKKYVIRIEKNANIIKKDIDKFVKSIHLYQADSSIIFTRHELQSDIKKYLTDKNCYAITKLEIKEWLNSKFISVLDFIEYLEFKEIRKVGKCSNRELIEKYRKLKEALGRQPTMIDINRNMDISYGIYSHRWGTFRNFIASINDSPVLRFSQPNKSLMASVSDLVEDYIRLRKKLKRTPTNLEIENKGKYTAEYYSVFFGTISNFVMVVENEIHNALKYKKRDLKKEYLSVQEIVKRIPTFNDVNKKSKISPIIFLYHWGTWNEFLSSIGDKKQYRNINDKELVTAFFDMNEKFNKIPSQKEFMKYCGVSHELFEYRFGSWSNFIELLKYPEFVCQTPNDIDLFTDYFRIKKILKQDTVSEKDIKKHTLFSLKDYNNYFGSYKEFKEQIDIIERKTELISEEELVNEYLRILTIQKKTWLTIYDIRDHSTFHYTIYLSKFQNWANIILLMRNYVGRIKNPIKIYNQQLIEDYHRVEKELNKSPLSITDYKKYGKYSEVNFKIRFGSWKEFLRSIGQKSVLEITNEELFEDYDRVKELLNKKIVFRGDYVKLGKYSDSTIRSRFGKWSMFLKIMGEDTSYIKKENREILIEEYQRVKKLLGKEKVNQPQMLKHGRFGGRTFSKYFGSWDKFLEFMGEDTSKFRHSEKKMIDEYYRVKTLLKKEHISIKDMNKYADVCGALYRLRFGSWKNFLDKIGEDTEHLKPITDEDLKTEYLRLKMELKKSKLIVNDITKHGKYKSKAYVNHFGSWDNFVRMMGDGNSRNLNTDQEAIDEYRRVKKLLGKDYITQNDMNEHGEISSALYIWRFGSWRKFLIHIGEDPTVKRAKKTVKKPPSQISVNSKEAQA